MKRSLVLIIGVILLLLLAACNAKSQYATQGVMELGGSISFSSSTMVANGETADESTTIFQFMPYINYFVFFDGFSLGLLPGINIIKQAGADESITNYAIFLSPGYTFTTGGNLFPYIEGLIGYTGLSGGSFDNNGISFGGKAGIKLSVGNNGLASIGVSYILVDVSPDGADERFGMNNLAITAGYSIFF